MKKLLNVSLFSMLAFVGVTLFSCNAQAPKANLKTDLDSIAYAQGVNVTQGLDQYLIQLGVDSAQMKDFVKGFLEGVNVNKEDKAAAARMVGLQIGQQVSQQMLPGVTQEIFGTDSTKKLNKDAFIAGFIAATLNAKDIKIAKEEAPVYAEMAIRKVKEELNKTYLADNAKFLEENAKKEGVVTLPSGLQYKVIEEGTGDKPTAESTVTVDYHGTTINGTVFDSSVERGTPATFALNQVIAGWTEGLQLMSVGSKYILYVPYDLAYGPEGRPGQIDPYATLIFEVTLHEIAAQ